MQQRFEAFTVLIAKISRSIRRIKAEEMSEFHLKGPHVSCLYYLTQLGPLTAGQLCDRCEEDKAAVSRSLEYLEQNGYDAWNVEGGYRAYLRMQLASFVQEEDARKEKTAEIERSIYPSGHISSFG